MKRILINNRRPATKAKEQAEQIVAQREKLKIFVENIRYGDWFVLNQMSKNLEHKFFVDFVVRLSTKINSKRLEGKFFKILNQFVVHIFYMKSYRPRAYNNTLCLGLPSFDLGVCEQLMGSKSIDDNKTRSTKGIRKPSYFRAVPRKLSISTGLQGTTFVEKIASPKSAPIQPDSDSCPVKLN